MGIFIFKQTQQKLIKYLYSIYCSSTYKPQLIDDKVTGKIKWGGFCECGNEPSCSIKCWKFLDLLRNCLLLKTDSAMWSWLKVT